MTINDDQSNELANRFARKSQHVHLSTTFFVKLIHVSKKMLMLVLAESSENEETPSHVGIGSEGFRWLRAS